MIVAFDDVNAFFFIFGRLDSGSTGDYSGGSSGGTCTTTAWVSTTEASLACMLSIRGSTEEDMHVDDEWSKDALGSDDAVGSVGHSSSAEVGSGMPYELGCVGLAIILGEI